MLGRRGLELLGTKRLTDSLWVRQLFRLMGLGLLAACDRGSAPFDSAEVGPKVKVQATIPEADAVDVPLDQSIRVQFDRFLSPLAVTRQAICISSIGPVAVAAGRSGCEQYPTPEYDPVDRVAVWKPSQPLKPGVRYTVTVFPPENEDDPNGIRAFDGAPLEAPYVFSFVTERRQPCGEEDACPDGAECRCEDEACQRKSCRHPSNEPNRHVDYCATPRSLCTLPENVCAKPRTMAATTVGPRGLLHGCGGSSCHSSHVRSRSHGVLGGTLVLTNDGIRDYIGQVAVETATGSDPTAVNRMGVPFGVNMPYIDPGFPANSYLLWKLVLGLEGRDAIVVEPTFSEDGYRCEDLEPLLNDGGTDGDCPSLEPPSPPEARTGDPRPGMVEPWIPPSMSQPIAEGEYDRLRRSLRGFGMPLGRPIDAASVRTLQAWIAAGAPVTNCDAP